MPPARMLATGLWLAVTVASTAVVWTATSLVAADVSDRPAPVLAHQDVVDELESDPSGANAPPPTTTPKVGSTTTTVPSRGRGAVPANPSAPVTATPPTLATQPGVTVPVSPAPTVATPAPGVPPTTRAVSPSTTVPKPTATWSTGGGVVRVACNGFFIELISAIPNNGYAVKVVAGGPVNVEVHFVRSDQNLSVKGVCFGQPIRYDDQIPPRPGSGPF